MNRLRLVVALLIIPASGCYLTKDKRSTDPKFDTYKMGNTVGVQRDYLPVPVGEQLPMPDTK